MISIVTTLFHSEIYLKDFYSRVLKVISKLSCDYEIIMVDDGSPDNSIEKALLLREQDKNVKIIQLSRNFGHHKAIMTGLSYAKGKKIFLIDSDLEEEPEWLIEFHEKMSQENSDVVFGVQSSRKGGIIERLFGNIYYKLVFACSGIHLSKNLLTARLMSHRFLEAMLEFEEQDIWLAGIWQTVGFKQIPCIVTKKSHSTTTYSFRRKLHLLEDSIISFSDKPLRGIFYLGIIFMIMSSVVSVCLLVGKIYYGIGLSGWTSIILSVWFFSGVIIFVLGVIGLYLAKIFIETKKRPRVIVDKAYL